MSVQAFVYLESHGDERGTLPPPVPLAELLRKLWASGKIPAATRHYGCAAAEPQRLRAEITSKVCGLSMWPPAPMEEQLGRSLCGGEGRASTGSASQSRKHGVRTELDPWRCLAEPGWPGQARQHGKCLLISTWALGQTSTSAYASWRGRL